jgi:hypothetical protein
MKNEIDGVKIAFKIYFSEGKEVKQYIGVPSSCSTTIL